LEALDEKNFKEASSCLRHDLPALFRERVFCPDDKNTELSTVLSDSAKVMCVRSYFEKELECDGVGPDDGGQSKIFPQETHAFVSCILTSLLASNARIPTSPINPIKTKSRASVVMVNDPLSEQTQFSFK